MQNIYTIGQMAEKLRKTVRTLQTWDRDGTLVAYRTPTGRRYYTREQLLAYFGETEQTPTKIIAYCRVSSQAQKPDLKNQVKILSEYCLLKDYEFVLVEEIGGGMNFKRKKFRNILEQVFAGEVSKIIVAHKDRLTRFGFDHLLWECKRFGCAIEVLNNEQVSPEQEMIEDLMTIVHCFSSRLYGLRNYRKELKKALKK